MRLTIRRLENNKGIALAFSLIITSLLVVYGAAFLATGVSQNLLAMSSAQRAKSFSLAESGLARAVVWLRAQSAPPTGNYTNPWGGSQVLGGGTYSATITDLGLVGASGNIRRYKVTSTGTHTGSSRVLVKYLQVDNYARYLWFTNQELFEGTNVWFTAGDRLNGPTHTNGHFNINQDPVFESQAQSVDTYIKFYNNGSAVNLQQTTNAPHDEPDFQQGFTFGAEVTTMPSQALGLRSAASSTGGLSLRGNTTIVLNANGTMNVTNSYNRWTNRNMPIPANGALFVVCDGTNCRNGGSLTISGTLNGRLTVGAQKDVLIPNSVLYAADPRTDPASDDTLGIIAERDVVIDDAAPSNMEINSCIMSMGDSFLLENYWLGSPRGTLTVYGGIIQKERGPVGTFDSRTGAKATGYSKDYGYDARLLGAPPPYMPTTGDYITLSWEET